MCLVLPKQNTHLFAQGISLQSGVVLGKDAVFIVGCKSLFLEIV